MLLVFRSNRSPEGDVATASRDGAAEPGSVLVFQILRNASNPEAPRPGGLSQRPEVMSKSDI